MSFRLISLVNIVLATHLPGNDEGNDPNPGATFDPLPDDTFLETHILDATNSVTIIHERLIQCVVEDVLKEWENFEGPKWQGMVEGDTWSASERDIAFRSALAVMGTLHTRHPSIPGSDLAEQVGFSQFCSESNLGSIRLDSQAGLVGIRQNMYERNSRARSIAALSGVAELGSLCPHLLVDSTPIDLRGLILAYRAIRAIPPYWPVNRVHITVDTVKAFHDSRSLLLGPVDILLEESFFVTTRTAVGSSVDIHDWFVAVNSDLASSTVDDRAAGRFLALCLLYGQPSLYRLPPEVACELVDDEAALNVFRGPAELQLDRVDSGFSNLVEGFHDIIPLDILKSATAEQLVSVLRTGSQKQRPAIPSIIPFMRSDSDAAPSDLALYISRNTQADPNFTILGRISQHLRQTPISENPLEKWANAGGPELLKLVYSLLTKSKDSWDAKPEALKGLMILVADAGADSEATGVREFCQTHQFELEELLANSVLDEGTIRHVLFNSSTNQREAVAMNCFAADWFTQCPFVLASNYLKGIALSHMVLRDIALTSDPAVYSNALLAYVEHASHVEESKEEADADISLSSDFFGRQIGWYLLDQSATSIPHIPLSAYQAALSGNGPVAAGLANVIPPASIARFAGLDISPVVLHEIVSLNPVRMSALQRSQVAESLYMAYAGEVRRVYERDGMRRGAVWGLCISVVKAAQTEDANLLAFSQEIGLNRICIDFPAQCRFLYVRTSFIESWDVTEILLQDLPSLFPEFVGNNRAAILSILFRARCHNRIAKIRYARAGIKEIQVRRDHVLEDSWTWLSEGPAGSHLRLGVAMFENELGNGPGVFADWFSLLASQLGRKVLQLRIETPQYYVPKPEASRAELVALGRLLGLALVLGKPIPLGLPLMFFAGLLPGYTDYSSAFAKDDRTVFTSYQTILGMSENVLKYVEIEINSVVVTVANRDQLIRGAIRGPFQGKAMEAILDGFSDIVPPAAFLHTGIISPNELQLLIQGASGVDVGEMYTNVKLDSQYQSSDDQIVWLFAFLEASDLETRRKFLHFVTGLSAVGVGGFSKNPIHVHYISGDDTRLPSSHTCSRTLDLPNYSSRAVLEEKLTIAINADSAMGTV